MSLCNPLRVDSNGIYPSYPYSVLIELQPFESPKFDSFMTLTYKNNPSNSLRGIVVMRPSTNRKAAYSNLGELTFLKFFGIQSSFVLACFCKELVMERKVDVLVRPSPIHLQ